MGGAAQYYDVLGVPRSSDDQQACNDECAAS